MYMDPESWKEWINIAVFFFFLNIVKSSLIVVWIEIEFCQSIRLNCSKNNMTCWRGLWRKMKIHTINVLLTSVVSQVSIVLFPVLMFVLSLSFSLLSENGKICWWSYLFSAGCVQHWWPCHKCKCYRAFSILLPNTPNWTGIHLLLLKNIQRHMHRYRGMKECNLGTCCFFTSKRWILVVAGLGYIHMTHWPFVPVASYVFTFLFVSKFSWIRCFLIILLVNTLRLPPKLFLLSYKQY